MAQDDIDDLFGSDEIVGEDFDLDDLPGSDTEVFEEPAVVGDEDDVDEDLDPEDAHDDALGQTFGAIEHSLAFRRYAEERAVVSRPVLVRGVPVDTLREWQIDFGPASAPAGQELTLTANPQCIFRGEKVMATDTAATPGTGTRIKSITVGCKTQRPANRGGTLTAFFGVSALGNGVLWDTVSIGIEIAVVVEFISACTFEMTVFGKGVV